MRSFPVIGAYVTVILLWSTTPLAIKWSGEGPGFLFGATARMSIGLFCSALLLALGGHPIPLHGRALRSYLAGAVHIYGSMLVMYWSAQFIPSGWVSVVFGLSPLMTALLAAFALGERSLTPHHLAAYAVGIAGLAIIHGSALELSPTAEEGLAGAVVATFLQCASAVWVKRIDAGLRPLAQVTGSLLAAVPAYLVTYVASGGSWPVPLPPASLYSILYLGIIATPLGFGLYFFVLKRLAATQVALISLVTPVSSLLLGEAANHEPLTPRVWAGTALILGALILHQFGRWRAPALLRIRGRSSRDSAP